MTRCRSCSVTLDRGSIVYIDRDECPLCEWCAVALGVTAYIGGVADWPADYASELPQ